MTTRDIHPNELALYDRLMAAEAVIIVVAEWLNDFYGSVETYDDGNRGMTQLDHGHEEYEARIEVAVAVQGHLR